MPPHTTANGYLDLLGLEPSRQGEGWLEMDLAVGSHLMAPNGYLHAGAVVSLADTACGNGCLAHLPDGAHSFTTVELKSNFLGTARDGVIRARAEIEHQGRTTQVWAARVWSLDTGRALALFRCTQMILYPR